MGGKDELMMRFDAPFPGVDGRAIQCREIDLYLQGMPDGCTNEGGARRLSSGLYQA